MDLDKIYNILNHINKNIEELNNRISNIEYKLKNNKKINNIKELKKHRVELDEKFIKDCLEKGNINYDVQIIKKIYFNLDTSLYPVKVDKKKYLYWLNNEWHEDVNGIYIKDVIVNNLHSCYLRCNKFDKYINNTDLYIKNQEYISFISNNDKYRNKLLNQLKEFIISSTKN